MIRKNLDDNWTLTILGKNVYGISERKISTKVPSSVYSTLLENGLMDDPFFRENELSALKLMENDFVYEKKFSLEDEQLHADRLILRFEGIDTIADIYLDGNIIGYANNMHRTWEYDITEPLRSGGRSGSVFEVSKEDFEGMTYERSGAKPGESGAKPGESGPKPGEITGTECHAHVLRVVLHSPTKYIRREQRKNEVNGSADAMEGFPHIRKAHCMFGWDWGPRLPDAGIFRDVFLLAVNEARIDHVRIIQDMEVTGRTVRGNEVKKVHLKALAAIDWAQGLRRDDNIILYVKVTSPDGTKTWSSTSRVLSAIADAGRRMETLLARDEPGLVSASVTIPDPELWWPNGYGEQPLYHVVLILNDAESSQELDRREYRLGLRTVTVNTDSRSEEGFGRDETFDSHMEAQTRDKAPGQNFAFEVNGLQIFAMGADYIPEDSLITRMSRESTLRLLSDAVSSHFNCIRIWGGGFYPADWFFDICDELGLLVWQDMMFACAAYELTEDFEENIAQEVIQNVRRIRNHTSLAVWSGNNENESMIAGFKKTNKQLYDYIRMYEYLIPHILKREDPVTFYWPSSPSSGGNFNLTEAENIGDSHYWGVWHGNEPFTAYRKHHFRFLSEFGFQSFPCAATVENFTEPQDRNIFSRIMEMHQRNTSANGKILNYLSATYLYPGGFNELLYASQMLQAEAIRYGVEHFRRFRGRCMGTIVWQLNDIWPVASWSSIDYFGRWKALQYIEKRVFAPVLLSCAEKGEIDQKPFVNTEPKEIELSAMLHVANETARTVNGIVRWKLCASDSSVIEEGSEKFSAPPYDGTWLEKKEFPKADALREHLSYELVLEGKVISFGSCLFCAAKHYHFIDPELRIQTDGATVTVSAKNYAKGVAVEASDGNLVLEDNYFDMERGERTLSIVSGGPGIGSVDEWADTLRVHSVYNIAGV